MLASVVEVANYYSEATQQEEQAEEVQILEPMSEPATSIILTYEPLAITSIPENVEESEHLSLSSSDEEVFQEVKPEEIEMVEKVVAQADAEEKRKRELQEEKDRLQAALIQEEEELQVYKRRKITSDAERKSRASSSRG